MVYNPHSWLASVVLALLLTAAIGLLFLNILTSAFTRIGFSPSEAFVLLMTSLLASSINIPVGRVKARIVQDRTILAYGVLYRIPDPSPRENSTVVGVNAGGAIIPIALSAYLLARFSSAVPMALIALVVVALAVNRVAKPVPGLGIVIPALWPPVVAALTTTSLSSLMDGAPEATFVTAYVSGTLGTLLGADIFNLNRIKELGAPIASIGGAGTFDGIFLTGLMAVLLI